MVTGDQIRAARGLLGWTSPEFAERASVSTQTISRFEKGAQGSKLGRNAMIRTLEEAGVEFIDGGVRWKSGSKPSSMDGCRND